MGGRAKVLSARTGCMFSLVGAPLCVSEDADAGKRPCRQVLQGVELLGYLRTARPGCGQPS